MGEHLLRMQEVVGPIPIISTKFLLVALVSVHRRFVVKSFTGTFII